MAHLASSRRLFRFPVIGPGKKSHRLRRQLKILSSTCCKTLSGMGQFWTMAKPIMAGILGIFFQRSPTFQMNTARLLVAGTVVSITAYVLYKKQTKPKVRLDALVSVALPPFPTHNNARLSSLITDKRLLPRPSPRLPPPILKLRPSRLKNSLKLHHNLRHRFRPKSDRNIPRYLRTTYRPSHPNLRRNI